MSRSSSSPDNSLDDDDVDDDDDETSSTAAGEIDFLLGKPACSPPSRRIVSAMCSTNADVAE